MQCIMSSQVSKRESFGSFQSTWVLESAEAGLGLSGWVLLQSVCRKALEVGYQTMHGMRNAEMGILVFVFLAVLPSKVGNLAGATTLASDAEALRELRDAVDPNSIRPASCLSSWNFSLDPCDNIFGEHFTCGLRCDGGYPGAKRVTEVTLDAAGYRGTLSPSIAKLGALQVLDLSNNLFRGSIPASIGSLSGLLRITLSHNSFSGRIPDSMGSLRSLQELHLDGNSLEGSIPAAFNNLRNLSRLELQGNKLGGAFPNLSGLGNLNFVDASDNGFSGPLPPALPTALVEISLRNNGVTGGLPSNLAEVGGLQVLDLSHNRLGGSLQSDLFDHPALEQLTLSHNGFSSLEVPGSYGTRSQLIAVDLSYNRIQGPLPIFMAAMPRLSALSLEYNLFTGIIPFQYAMKTVSAAGDKEPLVRLLLSGNYLFGQIPTPFMKLMPGSANVSFVDNCLLECPASLFFCQGGDQKSESTCRAFGPVMGMP